MPSDDSGPDLETLCDNCRIKSNSVVHHSASVFTMETLLCSNEQLSVYLI